VGLTISIATAIAVGVLVASGGGPTCATTTPMVPGGPDHIGGCWPGPTTTGVPAGTTLTSQSGTLNVTSNGAVVDSIELLDACVVVTGTGVTIKNSKLGCVIVDGGAAGTRGNPQLTIQDTEIDCPIGTWNTGFRFDNTILLRVNIHDCENGLDAGFDVTITDSYIHDLHDDGGVSFHNDGIQGTPDNVTIQHNLIYGIDTSAIGFNGLASNTVLIKDNLLAGGSFALYCPTSGTSNFQVIDNRFSTVFWPLSGKFGPVTDCAEEILSGNVYAETGDPI
jgi:hypothetical protein